MAKTVTLLRVFVASPSQLKDERAALNDVVTELNPELARREVQLELVKWETHAAPGFGADAQDVVNQGVDDDHDIFIGILWTHFGTPTGRACSGTEEEFQRAHKRYAANNRACRIMIYFKDMPATPSEIDPEQLLRVQAFQKRLGSLGGLYWNFSTPEDLTRDVRMHLMHHIARFGSEWGPASKSDVESAEPPTEVSSEPAAEEGLIDLYEQAQESMASGNESTNRIASALDSLAKKTQRRATEMTRFNQSGSGDIRKAKTIAERAAHDMEDFALILDAETPIFSAAFERALNSYMRITMMSEFHVHGKSSVLEFAESLTSASKSLGGSLQSIREFRGSVVTIPRVSASVNRARARVVSALDRLIGDFTRIQKSMESMQVALTAAAATS